MGINNISQEEITRAIRNKTINNRTINNRTINKGIITKVAMATTGMDSINNSSKCTTEIISNRILQINNKVEVVVEEDKETMVT